MDGANIRDIRIENYTRHTQNMTTENINLTTSVNDVRPMVYHED